MTIGTSTDRMRELEAGSVQDELKSALRFAQELPPEHLPAFLAQIEEIRYTAKARLYRSGDVPVGEDRLLSIEEASHRLGISQDFLYRNSAVFPFTRRLGRRVKFSSAGIDRYISQGGKTGDTRHKTLPSADYKRRR